MYIPNGSDIGKYLWIRGRRRADGPGRAGPGRAEIFKYFRAGPGRRAKYRAGPGRAEIFKFFRTGPGRADFQIVL